MSPALPRVLLVEDDPSIRRFVDMALDDMPIELLQAGSLAEAEAVLATGPVRLVISDLMLPDGSGMSLLQALATDPQRRGGARLAVFSAGISAEQRAQLHALGVDEQLPKPASLAELQDCVQRALALAPAAAPRPALPPHDVVALHFDGDHALYESFSASCRVQFAVDVRQGDVALQAADLPALRRLAHSLKSVLLTLGHHEPSRAAAALESLAAEGDAARAPAAWARLRSLLAPLAG